MSVRPSVWTMYAGGPQYKVDAVLRAHDADVGDQMLAPAPQRRDRHPAVHRRSGSGPVRTTVTSSGALRPRRIAISA